MIRLDRVSKRYRRGDADVVALDEVSLDIPRGQYCAVMGPSGSGKSTLLSLIGGLDTPTSGDVFVDGRRRRDMSDDEMTLFRRRKIGVVFQFFNLLPTLTVQENVALPLLLDGRRLSAERERVREMLELVGLAHRTTHRPRELSGGEMQRVAIARALVTDPVLLLADEPTGNLDSRTGEHILRVIREATERRGQTVILVTHDSRAAEQGQRLITIADGRVADDVVRSAPPAAAAGQTLS